MLNKNQAPNNNSFVGFAPVFPDIEKNRKKIETLFDQNLVTTRSVKRKDKVFSSLPESEKEVTEIKKLFTSAGYKGDVFTFNSANEKNLKSEKVLGYDYLHLATHGFINDSRPKLSGLLFADDSLSGEDNILYSEEIFTLNLNANLVVLSACESGLGKIKKGEGILGLARGFIYAGAKNLIVSLWQVADKSTSELMIEFYKNILNGDNYSSSLRNAKLKLIKEGTFSYPLEWAPFVLIGNN
jgi:CHAT domain-containing protein